MTPFIFHVSPAPGMGMTDDESFEPRIVYGESAEKARAQLRRLLLIMGSVARHVEDGWVVCPPSLALCSEEELHRFRANLRVGQKVFWSDPDRHISSGFGVITAINADPDVSIAECFVDVEIDGATFCEAFVHELYPVD